MRKSTRELIVFTVLATFILGVVAFFTWGKTGTALLWNISRQGTMLLPLVTVSALIDSVNPCAFSILILTIAFLVGLGTGRGNILKIGGIYIAGLFIVYILIGLGVLGTLHLFGTPHFMAKVGASLLIALGAINLVNEFFPAFPIKLRIPHAAHRAMATLMGKASMPTAFLLGALVGLCEFPCTGGPYLMVLGLLHDYATYFKGLAYLLYYNLIFVLPLIVILGLASNSNLLEKVKRWQRQERGVMRLWGGIAMVGLGILIFFL